MKYKHFVIITLITGIIMLTTMYFVPFEYHKLPIFAGMAIILTVYFSNKNQLMKRISLVRKIAIKANNKIICKIKIYRYVLSLNEPFSSTERCNYITTHQMKMQ